LFLEEVLFLCLKENMGKYTLSGAKLVTAERSTDAIGGTIAHVKKVCKLVNLLWKVPFQFVPKR
jgi:hypothetical protein